MKRHSDRWYQIEKDVRAALAEIRRRDAWSRRLSEHWHAPYGCAGL